MASLLSGPYSCSPPCLCSCWSLSPEDCSLGGPPGSSFRAQQRPPSSRKPSLNTPVWCRPPWGSHSPRLMSVSVAVPGTLGLWAPVRCSQWSPLFLLPSLGLVNEPLSQMIDNALLSWGSSTLAHPGPQVPGGNSEYLGASESLHLYFWAHKRTSLATERYIYPVDPVRQPAPGDVLALHMYVCAPAAVLLSRTGDPTSVHSRPIRAPCKLSFQPHWLVRPGSGSVSSAVGSEGGPRSDLTSQECSEPCVFQARFCTGLIPTPDILPRCLRALRTQAPQAPAFTKGRRREIELGLLRPGISVPCVTATTHLAGRAEAP